MSNTILTKAQELIYGDRANDYGSPLESFTRIGKCWAAILNIEAVTPEQVALCLSALKMIREAVKHKEDNIIDLAGYAGTLEKLIKERNG